MKGELGRVGTGPEDVLQSSCWTSCRCRFRFCSAWFRFLYVLFLVASPQTRTITWNLDPETLHPAPAASPDPVLTRPCLAGVGRGDREVPGGCGRTGPGQVEGEPALRAQQEP